MSQPIKTVALKQLLETLEKIAPLRLAEDWDNVGLLMGERDRPIDRVLTCLTVTPETVAEAIEENYQLIVSHHPIPFKPIKRLTDANLTERLLLQCARAGISIYSPHTAWDNAENGINAQLATMLDLTSIQPIKPTSAPDLSTRLGSGRFGTLEESTEIGVIRARMEMSIPQTRWRSTHPEKHQVRKIGIVCGSGGSYWHEAARAGCDALLTGEATYHQCLEAEANGLALLMLGHFASEFFAMKKLAAMIAASHVGLVAEPSHREDSAF